jgi:hypothetical protein
MVSIILSVSIGSPRFQMMQLDQIAGLTGGWTSIYPRPSERGGIWHVLNCPSLFQMRWQSLVLWVAHMTWSPIPARIEYEICLNIRLRRQWQFTSDPTLKAEVNPLTRVLRVSTPSPLWSHRLELLCRTPREWKPCLTVWRLGYSRQMTRSIRQSLG